MVVLEENKPWAKFLLPFSFSQISQSSTTRRTSAFMVGQSEIVASQRGEYFGVGYVLEIVVVLRDKSVAKGRQDKNARRKVGGFEDGQAIAGGERVGVKRGQEIWFGDLGVFPFVERGENRRG